MSSSADSHGFFVINKPLGRPSFQLVSHLRRLTKEKRIGFAGTLDPFARGVMILGVGREYTRQLDNAVNLSKSYRIKWLLGLTTDTLDSYGKLVLKKVFSGEVSQIEQVITQFVGTYDQMPPAFSAKKINGKPAYLLARKGEVPDLKSSLVTIDSIIIRQITPGIFPLIELDIMCKKGTYIRSLVQDMSLALDSVGYVKDLTRTFVGHFEVSKALSFSDLCEESIRLNRRSDLS